MTDQISLHGSVWFPPGVVPDVGDLDVEVRMHPHVTTVPIPSRKVLEDDWEERQREFDRHLDEMIELLGRIRQVAPGGQVRLGIIMYPDTDSPGVAIGPHTIALLHEHSAVLTLDAYGR